MSIQLSLANRDCCNIITNKNIPLMCNLINAWIVSNMGIKQKREMSKFTSQKNKNSPEQPLEMDYLKPFL